MEASESLQPIEQPTDAQIVKQMQAITRARAMRAFHGRGIERLIEIADTGKDKTALAAINILGKLTGDLTPHKRVDHRVTFEDLRKRSDGQTDALAGLFDIRADVIEAEIKEEAADDYEEWEAQQ